MRGMNGEDGRSEGEGQGRAVVRRLHAGSVRLAGGGNGAPLTGGRGAKSRPGRACTDLSACEQYEACRTGEIATQSGWTRQRRGPIETHLRMASPRGFGTQSSAPAAHACRSPMMVRTPAKSRRVKSCCDGEAKIAALAVADGLSCEVMPLTLTSERMEARPRVRRGEKWRRGQKWRPRTFAVSRA